MLHMVITAYLFTEAAGGVSHIWAGCQDRLFGRKGVADVLNGFLSRRRQRFWGASTHRASGRHRSDEMRSFGLFYWVFCEMFCAVFV